LRRRDFIILLGGAAAASPLAARPRPAERMRRIGVLMGYPEGDPQAQANITALLQGLQNLGWIEGRDVQIDYRWAGGDPDKARTFAKELIGLNGGLFNLFGNTAGITTPIVIGYIVKKTGSFHDALIFVGATAFMAIFSYLVLVGDIKRLDLQSLSRPMAK